MITRLAHIIFLSAITTLSIGQVREIRNVIGEASVTNITPEAAKEKAINAAKVEALRQAGAEEHVQSFDFLQRKETDRFEEYFYSLTSVQTMGNVIRWELVDETKTVDNLNNILYRVTINAQVQLYKTLPDKEFTLVPEGLKQVYKNQESLEFNVRAASEGYLNIFLLDESSSVTPLFPNKHETVNKVRKDLQYSFPQSAHFTYELFTEKQSENNYLIFLFTKKDLKTKAADLRSLTEFIYTIEPAERFVSVERLMIVK